MYTQEQANHLVASLVEAARQQGGSLDIRDSRTGAVVATVTAHSLPTRPQDMPRHLRPKQKLSKRARAAARREKLRPAA